MAISTIIAIYDYRIVQNDGDMIIADLNSPDFVCYQNNCLYPYLLDTLTLHDGYRMYIVDFVQSPPSQNSCQ